MTKTLPLWQLDDENRRLKQLVADLENRVCTSDDRIAS